MPLQSDSRTWRRIGLAGVVVGLLLAVGLLWHDLITPASVPWNRASLAGLQVERAEGLVIQDRRGDVTWATIGFSIYRSVGDGPFERVRTLFPSPNESWAAYSATFRRLSRHHEMVELLAVSDDELVAFAGGEVVRIDLAAGSEERVHVMRYFGRGVGRGLMPHGLTADDAGTLYYGEYPTRSLSGNDTVRIYRSASAGRRWEIAHEFPGTFVRHIHAVQWDPHGRALWVATGDSDSESRVGYSRDGGRTFTWIGAGSQRFRAVSLLFGEDRVTWATDADAPGAKNRLVSWNRKTGEIVDAEALLPGPGYYARALGADHGVVTLAERDAAVLLVAGASSRTLFRWRVDADPDRPHPSVRLLRSSTASDPVSLILNPLRTEASDAAVYRVSIAAATGDATVASLGGSR